ncbi:Protein FRIGIDA [Senna tora]|uniref:FRIGIDA-like protein n=1 Tax=Senna tora TaxID=362788 RepID=A0A834X889_9FABA|nr:Protein FRIGIDA [Senna tora]
MAKPSIDGSLIVKEENDPQGSTSASLPSTPPHQSLTSTSGNADARFVEIDKTVNALGDLSVAIHAFKSRFDELLNHLNFIDKAIHTRSRELAPLPNTTQDTATLSPTPLVGGNVQSTQPVNPQFTSEKENELDSDQKLKAKTENGDDLVSLCQMMNSRGLRKYIVSNLSYPEKLREEVPAALKNAPKPSKLVFECIGRFFLQGSRAYIKDSPMIPARQASVLVLEYSLMSGCVENDKGAEHCLKEEAGLAANLWKKRLIVEGGLSKASEIDARGLIFFVGCFGIPSSFRNEDIRDLIRSSNPREIMHTLRQSRGLLKRVSDMTDFLKKKGMIVEAVDLAYIFGFEDKLSPQTNLTSFLQKSEDSWKRTKQESRGSATLQLQADEKYLDALRSVVKCLEAHKIDHVKFLPGWKLKEKIRNLEKDIDDANRKIQDKVSSKRKVDKNDSPNKLKIPESKRSRFLPKDPALVSPSLTFLREQRIGSSNIDGNSLYDSSLAVHLLSSRPSSHLNNYPPASSVQLGSAAGSLAESVYGGTVASGSSKLIAGSGMSAGIGGTAVSFSGYHGDTAIDNVGSLITSNGQLYRRHGIAEAALSHERLVGQPARVNSLYGVSPSMEGFAGLPDHPSIGAAGRIGGSDLYGFADAVYEGESFQGSSSAKATNLSSILPTHGSSYMY